MIQANRHREGRTTKGVSEALDDADYPPLLRSFSSSLGASEIISLYYSTARQLQNFPWTSKSLQLCLAILAEGGLIRSLLRGRSLALHRQ